MSSEHVKDRLDHGAEASADPRGTKAAQQTVHTACRNCAALCGIDVTVEDNRVIKISADKQNPHTWHDFCAKGRTANQVVEHPRRILQPMRRIGDSYVEATWEEAINDIATRMNAVVAAGGPDALGIYSGNPTIFNSSNIAFMNAWLDGVGSGNRYFVGSVDQNAMHVVAEAMYGSEVMVLVSDIDNCDYFLLVGANPAVSAWNWLESVPGGWRRTLERQKQGATVVVVDPLRTETAEKADVHLAVRPGQDWALLLAMVKVILEEGLEHATDCMDLATGVPQLRKLVAEADLDDLAARCDIASEQIARVARDFANARGAMVVTRTGVSLHLAGTIGEWLGNVLNVITGRMDRPGGRRFERGHADTIRLFALGKPRRPTAHKTRLKGRAMIAGAHAVSELPDEITTPGYGQIRAMVINCGNPVVSGPDGAKLDKALEQLDLLVAIDLVQRESHRHAHWLLPATHWLERADMPSLASNLQDEPYIQYGARAVEPPPGAREEWQIFVDLALAMRRPLLGAKGFNVLIKASRWIAKVSRRPALAFGPHWLDRLVLATSRKVNGRKLKWRDLMDNPHGLVLGPREFGNFRNALRTEDKKVHAAPPDFIARTRELLADPPPDPPDGYPFHLGNRRNRHSMNSWLNELPGLHRSGRSNDIVINPKDAAALGISDGDRVRVFSSVAAIELTASVSDQPRCGVVVVDHGWGSRIFDPRGGKSPETYGINRNLLIDGEPLDPLSQTAPLNSSYVGIERIG
ncbi:molybdopterin-containing oxidoreductase family protein [Mycobacterium colombiense]|uniref:molybdopterin-containing oxidoreductase family protein n=1 Tax=Mycobacterium colombiense TaxID=339268 RepID=UPI00200B0784|nr:molybdopterin-dependent oxidoreductase [Mycobacterium colombiense]MCK8642343.1 molybdopterin-dependent oxidoreductase [Mycobacterium colombiense]